MYLRNTIDVNVTQLMLESEKHAMLLSAPHTIFQINWFILEKKSKTCPCLFTLHF